MPATGPNQTATQTVSRVASLPTFDPSPTLTPTIPPTSPIATAISPVSEPSPTQIPTETPPSVPTDTPVPPTPTPAPPTDTPVPPPSPTPAYPFVVVGVEKRAEQSVTIFEGTISDAVGNLLDGIFVQAVCGTYSTISFPSGATPWGNDKGPNAWLPGHYDINLAQPQPCAWQLTIVDTDDRKTVKANLSAPITIEVGPGESPIIVDWRKLY